MPQKVLVIGGLGLVGRAVVQALEADGTPVIAVSRRAPDWRGPAQWISVDLTDRPACEAVFSALSGITHIVYCALFEKPDLIAGWRDDEQIATNAAMLENVLDFVQPSEHFALLQGTKAYGAHLRPMSLPGRESDPRPPGANFYWNQEDLLHQRAQGWRYSIFRPQIVCGMAMGSPMNVVAAIAVMAALRTAQGRTFAFPGGGDFVTEVVDADLLARAILWAGRADIAAGETYNVTNGDVVHWPSLWPALAADLGAAYGVDEPCLLQEEMPALEPLWQTVVDSCGLVPGSLATMVGASWQFADAVFGYGGGAKSTLLSTIKIREHGFGACIDSRAMFAKHFRGMKRLRWVP